MISSNNTAFEEFLKRKENLFVAFVLYNSEFWKHLITNGCV